MTRFQPIPCPCGCKKLIMSPYFGCQCSSLRREQADELMKMQEDAERYRWIKEWAARGQRTWTLTVNNPHLDLDAAIDRDRKIV